MIIRGSGDVELTLEQAHRFRRIASGLETELVGLAVAPVNVTEVRARIARANNEADRLEEKVRVFRGY